MKFFQESPLKTSFLLRCLIRSERLVGVSMTNDLLSPITHLNVSWIDGDVTAMYDEAFKKQPGNEELGAQTFMANAKISNWKTAQQARAMPYSFVCLHLITQKMLSDFHQNAQNFQR